MKSFKIIKKGYYGNFFLLNFWGREIVRCYRSSTRERLFVFGKCVFTRWLPTRYLLKNILNNTSMQMDNLEKYMRLSSNVLLIVSSLSQRGGVESRLYQQASYLRDNGYQPIIITKDNQYDDLKQFPNIILDYKAPNFAYHVIELTRRLKPIFVEFQFQKIKYLYDIDINALKKITTVGACVHGILKSEYDKLSELDYRIYSCGNHVNKIKDAYHVPNFIKHTNDLWKYQKQAKALLISRITVDKLDTIKNFIQICENNHIRYQIAGTIDYEKTVIAQFISQLDDGVLLGEIDTNNYLAEHANEYLFVGGIGQVPIEAASFGIPALVVASGEESAYSTFLTAERLEFFIKWNFVIKFCPTESLGNTDEFFRDVACGKVERYSIASEINDILSIDKVMERYLDIVRSAVKIHKNNK